MTRNRFEEIMTVVHVADNEKLPANDRMAKVRPLFDLMNANFVRIFPAWPLQPLNVKSYCLRTQVFKHEQTCILCVLS